MNTRTADILKLIDCLNSLHDGDDAIDLLVACGEDAIPHLRKYLMEGQPSHIYQPRQKAVNALARLGAKDVLIEYLCSPKEIPDPAFRFGEEAVENTAARAIAIWRTDDVFEVLLQIAYTRTLPGVIEALGSFRRPEPLPLFIAALMDDVSRPAAESALKVMGETAKPALMAAALMSAPLENYESPSILLCRRSALRILAAMAVTVEDWSKLKVLLKDDDAEITVLTALIAMNLLDFKDKIRAVRVMIGKIPSVNWYVQTEVENCLVVNYAIVKEEIAAMIARLQTLPAKAHPSECTLRILMNIKRRGETE